MVNIYINMKTKSKLVQYEQNLKANINTVLKRINKEFNQSYELGDFGSFLFADTLHQDLTKSVNLKLKE